MQELSFRQYWLKEQTPTFQPGKVLISRSGDTLHLEARLTDRAIHSPEASFNDEVYRFSDVFELFIKAEGDPVYHELHFTPSNVKLQLRFNEHDARPFNLDTARIWDTAFSTSEATRDAEGWTLKAEFSLASLSNLRPLPTRWKIGCGRYDYQKDASTGEHHPVLSNTAPLTVVDYHRHHEWETVDLVG